jgi:hypothetical protein
VQLSSAALAQITSLTQGANPNYSAAYAVALQDLTASTPNASGSDADVLQWIAIAEQVNSGATTPQAIAIRANNVAASELILGTQIALFGPQEQAASNAIAASFFQTIIQQSGVVPDFAHVMNIDAQAGLAVLGLPQYAWAGAVPDSVASSQLVGFATDNFYDNLTSSQQVAANVIHGIASVLATDELIGLSLGISQATIDNIIQADAALDTHAPFLQAFETAAGAITLGGAAITQATQLSQGISQLATNFNQSLADIESDLQDLLTPNPGITDTSSVTDSGPDLDLNLSVPSDPIMDIYVSASNGPSELSGGTPIVEDLTYLDNQGTAIISNPTSYSGTIYSFVPNDTIDLAGIGAAAGAALVGNNVLTINGGTVSPVTLYLDPTQNYNGDSFLIASDGDGGTEVTAEDDTQPIAFTGTSEVLLVVNPGSLTGTISAFILGDTIDLTGIVTATGAALGPNNALTVQEGSGGALTLNLDPNQNFAGEAFATAPDGNGGTEIEVIIPPVRVIFDGNDSNDGNDVWVTDGTAAGTKQLFTGSGDVAFTTFGDEVLFELNDTQLWISDGTAAGTQELAAADEIGEPTVIGNKAIFMDGDELEITGGTAADTQAFFQLSGAEDFTALGNVALFDDSNSAGQWQLWVTDGTATGTQELTTVTDFYGIGVGPNNITSLGTLAVFDSGINGTNNQLWVTDGTASGTHPITDITFELNVPVDGSLFVPVEDSINPSDFDAFGDKVLFIGWSPSANSENCLYRTLDYRWYLG